MSYRVDGLRQDALGLMPCSLSEDLMGLRLLLVLVVFHGIADLVNDV